MRNLDLPHRARLLGELMTGRLKQLGAEHAYVGDVRGRGAMVAAELVRPGTREPAPEVAAAVSAACHREGVLTLTSGTYGNVLRFLPPLVIREALLDEAFDVLEGAVAAC
jgi:4-aminobutyrate aminotransferase/(S)-3-amino-2-methylpropionate transaminase